jgi:two-component system, chemotaxis family, CheB/CheR fusion protein
MSNPENVDPEFEALLEYLRQSRSFDFTGYKRSSLRRRIQKQMQSLGIEGYGNYLDHLEVYPEEFISLFNTILINVTSFFRDPEIWQEVANTLLPRILEQKTPNQLVRCWSMGCSSGEEAYSLAIILAENLGLEQFRTRVKIFATDVDEEALNQARQASYTLQQMEAIPPELRLKYFEPNANRWVFRRDLRRSVIFGRHDLIQDAPISRIDLLSCRNTLMYFNSKTQTRVLKRFYFALNDNGYLFLGKAEMLFACSNLFIPVDLKRRFFTKVPNPKSRDRLLMVAQPRSEDLSSTMVNSLKMREAAFNVDLVAQVVVDAYGSLVLANEQARTMFDLDSHSLGQPLQDLELSYRPVELRAPIEQVCVERRPLQLREISWRVTSGKVKYLDIQILPLQDDQNNLLGTKVIFTDVSRYKQLQEELEHSRQELETAYEELQSINEELETTNEELQSTVEELETTNEELQSTNEELETMNEELQSTNEELQTMNEELREQSEELDQVNGLLASILTSLQCGVVVLNQDFQIQIWNYKAEDLWGLRADEVRSRHFLSLDIGLPTEQLRQPIRSCLMRETQFRELTLDATNRRGKAIQCKVTCTTLLDQKEISQGVILLMDELLLEPDSSPTKL